MWDGRVSADECEERRDETRLFLWWRLLRLLWFEGRLLVVFGAAFARADALWWYSEFRVVGFISRLQLVAVTSLYRECH